MFPRVVLQTFGMLVFCTTLTLLVTSCATRGPDGPASHTSPAGSSGPKTVHPDPDPSFLLTNPRQIIVRTALDSVGRPYKWGGHSPHKGFDCSGLVYYAHNNAGLKIPRTAKEQWRQARKIHRIHMMAPGDLVFFSTSGKSKAVHVGIFIGDSTFIHAPGKGRQVTRARLDNHYFIKRFKGAATFL